MTDDQWAIALQACIAEQLVDSRGEAFLFSFMKHQEGAS